MCYPDKEVEHPLRARSFGNHKHPSTLRKLLFKSNLEHYSKQTPLFNFTLDLLLFDMLFN